MALMIDDDKRARVQSLKLSIELVPEPLWCKSLRYSVPSVDWNRIRKDTYKASGYRCQICGVIARRMNCHEIWEYDDVQCVQRLKGIEAICTWCHLVKHFGFTEMRDDEELREKVIKHFMEVNSCTYYWFVIARAIAVEVWEARNEFAWTQDFGVYSGLANKQPFSIRPNRRA
jgi:hypothetical protein